MPSKGWEDGKPARTGVYTARASDGGGIVRVTKASGKPHDIPLDYSPDGTQLVYCRAVRAEPDFPIDKNGSLWVVRADGSGAQRLQTGEHRPADRARWSPDGNTVLFASERESTSGAIWTIRPKSSRPTKLYEDPSGGFPIAPTWSPDGRHIVFALDPSNDAFLHEPNQAFVIRADGTGLTKIGEVDGFKATFEWIK